MEKEFDFKNIGKRMPYRTPDGFFGKMQKQVLERTQAERFNRQHRIKLIIGAALAIAAVMLGVLFSDIPTCGRGVAFSFTYCFYGFRLFLFRYFGSLYRIYV